MKDNLEKWNELQRRSRLKYAAKLRSKPRKVKATKRGVVTLKSAKKKAWDSFSLWVRLSACNNHGFAACVTCGAIKHYKKLQAGHFVPGRGNAILFDERGVHPQCFWCNNMLKGNPRKYDMWMRKHYGQAVIDELDALSGTTKKYTIQDLQDMHRHYHDLTVQLMKKVYTE